MKPNAGLPEIINGKAVYNVTPEEFAQKARRLWEADATFIGGYCGVTPPALKH